MEFNPWVWKGHISSTVPEVHIYMKKYFKVQMSCDNENV